MSLKLTTLYISSKDRTNKNTTDPNNFNICLSPLGFQCNNKSSYSIKSVVIPFSYYVTSYKTPEGFQSFTLSNGSGLHNITVNNGNYNANQLISEILPQLQAFGTFSMSYSNITNKFLIESDAPFSLLFSSNNSVYQYQRLGLILGFSKDQTGASSYISDICANLSGPPNIYIKSAALSYNQVTNFFINRMDTVICAIPTNSTPFGIIIYTDQMQFKQPFYSAQSNFLDFQLVDDYDNLIDLNGCDWSLTISIYNDSI